MVLLPVQQSTLFTMAPIISPGIVAALISSVYMTSSSEYLQSIKFVLPETASSRYCRNGGKMGLGRLFACVSLISL